MQKKIINFWYEKQKIEQFTSSEWLDITASIKTKIVQYPNYETYQYSFKDPYTNSEAVNEFGIFTNNYNKIIDGDELLEGKWVVFLAKNIYVEKLNQLVEKLLGKDLIVQLKFRDYPILNEEQPADLIDNFVIISHDLKYKQDFSQEKVFLNLGMKPLFRFDLERKLDLIHINPNLQYTYKNIDSLNEWLGKLKKFKKNLQNNTITEFCDIDRIIKKVELNISLF